MDITPKASQYWIMLVAMGMAQLSDATSILNMNFILSDEGFSKDILKGDFAFRGSMLAGCVFGGMLVGGVLTGAFSDQMGRRPILLAGITLNSIAGLIAAFVPNFISICIFRFISGAGVGAILSIIMPLATESSAPSKRGRNISFISSFFTLGTIYVAILAIVLFGRHNISWRVFMACCVVPSVIANVMVPFYVPESARYLAVTDRLEEACESANRIANSMGYDGPLLEIDEIKANHKTDSKLNESCTKMTIKEVLRKTMISLVGLYDPSIRLTTITLQVLWITVSFGSGLIMWITMVLKQIHVSNIFMNSLFFSAATIPGNVVAAFLMDQVGRKKLLVFSLVLCSLSLFYFAHIAENVELDEGEHNSAKAVMTACVFHFAIVISWSTTNVITCELFPTEIRTTGCGLCTATGRLAAMLSQYVFGSLIHEPSALLSLTSIAVLFGCFCTCFIQDTTNQALSDTIANSERKHSITSKNSRTRNNSDIIEKIKGVNATSKLSVELI